MPVSGSMSNSVVSPSSSSMSDLGGKFKRLYYAFHWPVENCMAMLHKEDGINRLEKGTYLIEPHDGDGSLVFCSCLTEAVTLAQVRRTEVTAAAIFEEVQTRQHAKTSQTN